MSMTFTTTLGKKTKSEEKLLEDGLRRRERTKERSRKALEAASDIGEIPPCVDPVRRYDCGMDLLLFLETYFPQSTGLSPFGADQIRAIRAIEVAIIEGGWVCNVLPRGFVKSTISENSLLWALLYGYRKFGLFFAGTSELSTLGIHSITQELETNELLLEDFPEACVPIAALEGRWQRAAAQTYKGELTGIEASKASLRLAEIPGFLCAGGMVRGFGLLSPPRGIRYKTPDGRNVRPDFSIIDDPSTDASAVSDVQNDSRYNFIYKSISNMGAHGKALPIVVNATVIKDGDLASRLCDIAESPEWSSLRVAMVKQMPVALETMWLGEYARILQSVDRLDPMGHIVARQNATAFLQDNYDAMHEGHEVAWDHIGLERYEISALQHAMNILITKGPDVFSAECQNRPLTAASLAQFTMDATIKDRKNGYDRRVVPRDSAFLVFGIDVHVNLLYYTVAAVKSDFTGSIIDTGTWPEQRAPYFSLASAKQTLQKMYGGPEGDDNEICIERGVKELIYRLMHEPWEDENQKPFPVTCGLVDAGYKRAEVRAAIRQSMPEAKVVLASRGVGIGPTKKPMAEYDLSPKRVVRYGPAQDDPRWIIPQSERDGDLFGLHFDSNFWKDVVAARFVQTASTGKWDLFGGRQEDHSLYVSHLLAEKQDLVSSNGRTVSCWSVKGNQDNHYFDTTVLCAVAASLAGAQLPTTVEKQAPTPAKTIAKLKNSPDFGDFFASARE